MMNISLIKIAVFFILSICSLSTYADWSCDAIDQGGHRWVSAGLTQDHAQEVANSYCSAYSPNSTTCHAGSCSEQ